MTLTPSDIFVLALRRHRTPWNFTVQAAAMGCFVLTLLLHSFLLLATSLIFFGAGFFELPLPEMGDGRWRRFVMAMIEWEKNWSSLPWTFRKWARFICVLILACVLLWALWAVDILVLCLFAAFGYLAHIVAENRDAGIDP
jgi:hypothetical protein